MDHAFRGRGATANPGGRFERHRLSPFDDGWGTIEELVDEPGPQTEVRPDASRSVIAENDSPDIGFDRSINPYRGCEHGCIYCYARPFHGFLGLSSGLDFETKIFAKHDAAVLLRKELDRPSYQPKMIALGAATDPYQPVERRLRITRSILEVMAETRHPIGIVTKSASVVQDLDLLQAMAKDGLLRVHLSVTTLDAELARTMEPRCSSPKNRLRAIAVLADAGIPVGVNIAPIVPGLTDHEIEAIVAAAASAGADALFWTLVRLPYEVKGLFTSWLEAHRPARAARILSLIRQSRAGQLNDPKFGSRMKGQGVFAELIGKRIELAMARHGLSRRRPKLRTDLFRRPSSLRQLDLI